VSLNVVVGLCLLVGTDYNPVLDTIVAGRVVVGDGFVAETHAVDRIVLADVFDAVFAFLWVVVGSFVDELVGAGNVRVLAVVYEGAVVCAVDPAGNTKTDPDNEKVVGGQGSGYRCVDEVAFA